MARTTTDESVAALLQEAAETHHHVYRITDGTRIAKSDESWPNFYARHLREQFASR